MSNSAPRFVVGELLGAAALTDSTLADQVRGVERALELLHLPLASDERPAETPSHSRDAGGNHARLLQNVHFGRQLEHVRVAASAGPTVKDFYSSATTNAGNPSRAWLVGFVNGNVDHDFETQNFVRAVR